MKWLMSICVSTLETTPRSVKLGQPVPDSNVVSEMNGSAPHDRQR